MIRVGTALVSALLLSACWADDQSGTVIVRPTAETPGGFTLASTLAAPTYTKFADLTGDQAFTSACVFLSPLPAVVSLPDQGLAFSYTDATQTWAISGDGQNLSFGPADVDPSAPAGQPVYAKPGIDSFINRLRIQTPGIGGIGPLEYARTALVGSNSTGTTKNYTCVIGVPTLVTDVPPTSTVPYTAAYSGSVSRTILGAGGGTTSMSLGWSPITLSADLLTGQVTLTFHLIATPASGPNIDLGTVTGVADIDPATGGYYGTTWSSATLTSITGQFSGSFFGPQGKETALVLSLSATSASTSPAYTLRTTGTVVGFQ